MRTVTNVTQMDIRAQTIGGDKQEGPSMPAGACREGSHLLPVRGVPANVGGDLPLGG